jgi:hypothetical protein
MYRSKFSPSARLFAKKASLNGVLVEWMLADSLLLLVDEISRRFVLPFVRFFVSRIRSQSCWRSGCNNTS